MKIGRTIITIRRESGRLLHDEVDTVLREIVQDPTHEFRKLIAHTSRSSAKDFLGNTAETQLASLAELVWPLLEPRLIELLKSHTPGHTNDLSCPCCAAGCCGPHGADAHAGQTLPPIDPTASAADVLTIPGSTPLITPLTGPIVPPVERSWILGVTADSDWHVIDKTIPVENL